MSNRPSPLNSEETLALAAMELAESGRFKIWLGPQPDMGHLHDVVIEIASRAGVDHVNIIGAEPDAVIVTVDRGLLIRLYRIIRYEVKRWLEQRIHP
jgi:hypothetical protein